MTGTPAETSLAGGFARRQSPAGRAPEAASLRPGSNPGRQCLQDHQAGSAPSPRYFETDRQSPSQPNAASIPSTGPQPATYPTDLIALDMIPPIIGRSRSSLAKRLAD